MSLGGDVAEGKHMPLDTPAEFPGPVAEAYYWDDSPVVAIVGPVGSGKTTTKMQKALRRAVMMPRSSIDGWRYYDRYFVRETYRQLWSSVIPSYVAVYPRSLGDWAGGRGAPVQHSITFDDGNGPILFRATFMAFGDSVMESMRGIQMTDLDIGEADTNPVETLTFGIGRIDRAPGRPHFAGYPPHLRGWGQVDCDFNAPDEDNWTFKVFYDAEGRRRFSDELTRARRAAPGMEDAPPVQIGFHRQPGFGEPGCENLHNLSPGYYENQIATNRLAGRGDVTERMVFNRTGFLRAGEPVFLREFNRQVHVAPATLQPWPGVPLRIGLDQGFKGAALIGQFRSRFHWQILAELHFPDERLLAAEFGRRLRDLLDSPRFRGLRIEGAWADMAGEHGASAAADENDTWNLLVGRAAGFRVRPQRIGTNRLQPRLEAVRAALEFMEGGQPGLLIDPACLHLIRGFAARYVWTDEIDSRGDKRKVPDKRMTEANVMDALQYLALSEVRGNGLTPLLGHNGGPSWGGPSLDLLPGRPGAPFDPREAAGLVTAYDPLNPYGD